MSPKPFIFTLLVLLLLTGIASASLSAPTTYSIGYKVWGKYWDMMGENGVRNGTLGGVGNNVTFLDGSGITFLPISGTASDLDMNGKNITNARVINSTQVEVTTVNATNIIGNGSGISDLNASNLTNPIAAINGSTLFGLNMSNQTTCRGNMTCTYNANGSVSLDATSNLTAIFNRILNSSTVTAGVYPNGSVELTAAAAATIASITNSNYVIGNATVGTVIYLRGKAVNAVAYTPWTYINNTAGQEGYGFLFGNMNKTITIISNGSEWWSPNTESVGVISYPIVQNLTSSQVSIDNNAYYLLEEINTSTNTTKLTTNLTGLSDGGIDVHAQLENKIATPTTPPTYSIGHVNVASNGTITWTIPVPANRIYIYGVKTDAGNFGLASVNNISLYSNVYPI